MLFYFSLVILILTIGASLFWRRSFGNLRITNLVRIYEYIFLIVIVLIFILLFYQSWQQYQFWSRDEVSQFLLPPYQSINYFIFYAIARFFAPYLISLAVAILFLFSAKALNKKYQERFFKPEEPYFGAIAIFLTGHPGWLFYLVILIFIYLVLHLSLVIGQLSIVKGNRISLYYLWLPTGIFVIIIQRWLELLPLWSLLKI